MTMTPRIPMRAEELPQQRITLVVDLPACPPGFECHFDLDDSMPEAVRPKGSPRNTVYLGQVEWAWSPVHNRLDAYYLHRRGPFWLLWLRWQDENDWDLKWVWTLYAWGRGGRRVDPKTAAIHLLLAAWKGDTVMSGLDRFSWINEERLLSVEELTAIAREVWGGDTRT